MFRGGLILAALVAYLALWAPRRLVEHRFAGRMVDISDAPHAPVGIVFGAGLLRDGRPTTILYDRVAAAAQLYSDGKVDSLLMSGHETAAGYSEPQAMRILAEALGVPAEAIQTDGLGTRTFTTCERALSTFGIGRALLITQNYHLPRALVICAGLGMDAVGVSADLRPYNPRAIRYWETREIPATLVALVEITIAGLR
ncbi:MAG: YdcF family protein [Chloroflexi bacterium]|nr:YdcF family protein [Chloroflexota bacterium]MCH8338473.1 YdcF family protein [Chloroflexota bacterium]